MIFLSASFAALQWLYYFQIFSFFGKGSNVILRVCTHTHTLISFSNPENATEGVVDVEGVLSWTWLLLQVARGEDDCMSSSRWGLTEEYSEMAREDHWQSFCHKLPGNLSPARLERVCRVLQTRDVLLIVMSVSSFHSKFCSRFPSPFGDESKLSALSDYQVPAI